MIKSKVIDAKGVKIGIKSKVIDVKVSVIDAKDVKIGIKSEVIGVKNYQVNGHWCQRLTQKVSRVDTRVLIPE